jgi:CubicO group peptidase (beta-lactamase class C family)
VSTPEICGFCPPQLEPVREAFAGNFAAGTELGARYVLAIEGEIVLDLWAGHADRAQTRRFDDTTLTPVFSTTKAVAALMVARLVGQRSLAYGQRVRDVWPEFGQAGKAAITVEEALSHQAGLCGFAEPMDPALWLDWNAICGKLEVMAPLWPAGSASGYHPVTFGYLAGEIFRRIDGRTLGIALAQDVAKPLGLDIWIGLPEAEDHRIAEVRRPPAMPALGEITEPKRLAFMTPWASPEGRNSPEWRRAEIPSANGFGTAAALARLMAALACDGVVGGHEVLAPGTAALAARERILGPDLVLPRTMSWGAGLMRSAGSGLYGPGGQTVGHSGWGGSCAFADPERRLSGAYVMNRQSSALIDDARAERLISATYAAMG